jgi:hypothetical protein
LTGLATIAIPGVGMALVGAPIAVALGAAAAGADDDETPVERVLRHVGLTEVEARGYALGIHRGHTLVAVDVADDQSALVADIFHHYGGTHLESRHLG